MIKNLLITFTLAILSGCSVYSVGGSAPINERVQLHIGVQYGHYYHPRVYYPHPHYRPSYYCRVHRMYHPRRHHHW